MNAPDTSPRRAPSRLEWIVWSALALTIAGILVAFLVTRLGRRDATREYPVRFAVAPFTLTNQFGAAVSRDDLRGHVWVADIVFTRCAGPCPELTRKMASFQSALPADASVRFVTLTADPENDTPAVLEAYGRRAGAQPGRWWFLTGTRKQIVDVAVDALKFIAIEKEPGQRENDLDLFIHSTNFLVVDRQGRVRAVFDSEEPDTPVRVIAAVHALLRER